MNKQLACHILIPNWIVWVQAICFLVLYAIWALPETILIRHICLITGALLSLWIIYQYRHSFFHRRAIPLWLIVALFAWATFHLFFLSNNFAAQYAEFASIWKRTALGAIFAFGFGIGLSSLSLNCHSRGFEHQKSLWALIFLGLLGPTLIYIVKFFLTYKVGWLGIGVPDYLKLYPGSAPFYLPKTTYVCFCLPTLGIALGKIAQNINKDEFLKPSNFLYLVTIGAILFIFYSENIKNGVIHGTILLILFVFSLIFRNFLQNWRAKLILLTVVTMMGIMLAANSFQRNVSWRTFISDAIIALDTTNNQNWIGSQKPGINMGGIASEGNYVRIAWAKVGLGLLVQHPLGYGLVECSFGSLVKIEWPSSNLCQSHSGWIDLTLGLGLPGFLLILVALLILLFQLNKQMTKSKLHENSPYLTTASYSLISLLMIWSTTEVSQRVYFDFLIFWLAFAQGFTILTPEAKIFSVS